MPQFMVLYNSSTSASDLMSSASQTEMQASMAEWMSWRDEASRSIKVDFGMPLQTVENITAAGMGATTNPASGYSMLEGEREEIVDLLKSHPHLKRPGASIDLLELLPMPGIAN